MKKSSWGNKGQPGPDRERTSVKVEDLMVKQVVTVTRHQLAGKARELMSRHRIHSIPVVDAEGAPVGIVTSTDLIEGVDDSTSIGQIMTPEVQRVSQFAAPSLAAQLMRKHHIHHLVVTNDGQVSGILSTFDLLQLVEERRFSLRQQKSPPKKSTWEKRQQQGGDGP